MLCAFAFHDSVTAVWWHVQEAECPIHHTVLLLWCIRWTQCYSWSCPLPRIPSPQLPLWGNSAKPQARPKASSVSRHIDQLKVKENSRRKLVDGIELYASETCQYHTGLEWWPLFEQGFWQHTLTLSVGDIYIYIFIYNCNSLPLYINIAPDVYVGILQTQTLTKVSVVQPGHWVWQVLRIADSGMEMSPSVQIHHVLHSKSPNTPNPYNNIMD